MDVGKALMVIPGKIKKMCLANTRHGKVNRLEELTKSLEQNTDLVTRKYNELAQVEKDVNYTLNELRQEDFENEQKAINDLALLDKDEKAKFCGALMEIKEKGIAELEPITTNAQKMKAHMLITLNKAKIQKAILLSKTRLVSNASLQIDTLKVLEKETSSINGDLSSLLNELNILNDSAITQYTEFKKESTEILSGEEDIIGTIMGKYADVEVVKKSKKTD